MELVNKKILVKLKKKNRGNKILINSIDKLIHDIESAEWGSPEDLLKDRPDADCVHSEGFYFFNINVHRTMIMLQFEDGEASIVWAGSHDDYQVSFKDNKKTIEKWLRYQGYIK